MVLYFRNVKLDKKSRKQIGQLGIQLDVWNPRLCGSLCGTDGDSYICLKLSYDFPRWVAWQEILRYNEGIRNESKPSLFQTRFPEGGFFMRRYA